MHPLDRPSSIIPRTAPTTEQELTTFSEQFYRFESPAATMGQELETFFASNKPFLPLDLLGVIAGYADENRVLAMRNSREPPSKVQFDSPPDQEEIGAIMCAFSALPGDFDPVHKQIMLNGFNRGGRLELVKIFNEMSRIREKVNIDDVIYHGATLTGPCKLNSLSAIGAKIRRVRFENFQLRGANFNASIFHSVAFINVDLRNACLCSVHWDNVGFQNVDVTGLNTNNKALVQFMETQKKKNPQARIFLNGLLHLHGLTLDAPPDKKCSVM